MNQDPQGPPPGVATPGSEGLLDHLDVWPESPPATPRQRFLQKAMAIVWPAFVMAGVLEALVFVVVDPDSLRWFGADALNWPAQAVYSVTFFLLWGAIATSGAITQLLQTPPAGTAGPDESPARWP